MDICVKLYKDIAACGTKLLADEGDFPPAYGVLPNHDKRALY
jgi:hypothetical protein